jgi:chromate transporter
MEDARSSSPPTLGAIFGVFFRIGLLSFGGGLTGWVHRELVLLRGWMPEDEFMSGLALCQILPGGNICNFSVYAGQKLHGALGSCAALLGLVSGPFFFVLAVVSAYGTIEELPFVQAAMDGVAASAIGLSLIVAARGARLASGNPAALIALAATFVGVGLLQWSLPIVAAVVGALSVAAAWVRSGHEG